MRKITSTAAQRQIKKAQSSSTVWRQSRTATGYSRPSRVRPDLSMAGTTSAVHMLIERIRAGGK